MSIPFGNYILDIYYGSMDMGDYCEHLYYRLDFKTVDNVPIVSIPIYDAEYNILLECMEYLPEYCYFIFECPPSEMLTHYQICAEYVTDDDGYEIPNTMGLSNACPRVMPYGDSDYIRIMIVKQSYPLGKDEIVFDTKMTHEQFFNVWKYMEGSWAEEYAS